jgi:uncharacterized protein (DUF3084 family)
MRKLISSLFRKKPLSNGASSKGLAAKVVNHFDHATRLEQSKKRIESIEQQEKKYLEHRNQQIAQGKILSNEEMIKEHEKAMNFFQKKKNEAQEKYRYYEKIGKKKR